MSFAFSLLLIIVGTFSVAVLPTAGQTLEWDFYVSNFGSDSGRGTEGDPFETISQALLSMEQIINIAGPTVSAVRIYLLAGIFSGPGNQQLSFSIPKTLTSLSISGAQSGSSQPPVIKCASPALFGLNILSPQGASKRAFDLFQVSILCPTALMTSFNNTAADSLLSITVTDSILQTFGTGGSAMAASGQSGPILIQNSSLVQSSPTDPCLSLSTSSLVSIFGSTVSGGATAFAYSSVITSPNLLVQSSHLMGSNTILSISSATGKAIFSDSIISPTYDTSEVADVFFVRGGASLEFHNVKVPGLSGWSPSTSCSDNTLINFQGSSLTITDSSFTQGIYQYLFLGSSASSYQTVSISGTIFADSQCTAVSTSGGVHLTITNSTFSSLSGGALLHNVIGSGLQDKSFLTSVLFQKNSASDSGGAITNWAALCNVQASTFIDNTGAVGLAVYDGSAPGASSVSIASSQFQYSTNIQSPSILVCQAPGTIQTFQFTFPPQMSVSSGC